MSLKKINTVLAAAFILFILWFGTEYILSPGTTAPSYGLPSWPSGDGDGFLIIKGIRDVVLALVLGILLVTGHRRALGWVLLVEATAAYGDMTNVLAHHGSMATALGVHCLTATLMVVNGLLILRETRKVAAAPATPALQPA
jgi:TRAP-type C4-dicarboxylate transport system permease small subunit